MNANYLALAEKVRFHLHKKTPNSLPYIPFNEFPHGCCSDSALILAEIINRRIGCSAEVVSFDKGCNGLADSHAWVDIDGLCLDITLDQFNIETCMPYPTIHVGPYLPIHTEYANGEPSQVSKPCWLAGVVEEIDLLLGD